MPPKRKSLPTETDDKTRKAKMVKKMEPPKTWKEAEYSAKLESEYKEPIKYDEYMEGGIPDSLLEGLGFSESEVLQDSSGAGADDDEETTGAERDHGAGAEPMRNLDPSSVLAAQGMTEAMSSYVVDQISAMAKSGLISSTLPQQIVDFTLAASNKTMATAPSQAQARKPVTASSTSPVRTSRRLSARNNTPTENTITVDSSRSSSSASRLYTPTPVVRPTPPRLISQFAPGGTTRPTMPMPSSLQPTRQPLPRNTRVYNTAPRTITKGNIVYERMPTGEVIASLIKKPVPDGSSGRPLMPGDSAQRGALSSYRGGVPTSSASPLTFDECPINEFNVGEVLEKSIKATQSMRMLLTSLRDDLRRIGAGSAMVTEEQVRKRQEVADKLTKAYATYKRSIEDIEMPQAPDITKTVTATSMASHRSDKFDLPARPVMLVKHGIPMVTGANEHGSGRGRGASATVTGPAATTGRAQDRGEVIELSESDDETEQNGRTSHAEGNRFIEGLAKSASGRQRSDGVRSADVGKRSSQKDGLSTEASETKAGKPDSTDIKRKDCNGVKGSGGDEKK